MPMIQLICTGPTMILGLTSYILSKLRRCGEEAEFRHPSTIAFLASTADRPIPALELLQIEIVPSMTSIF